MLPGAVAEVAGIAKGRDEGYLAALRAEIGAAGLADRIILARQVPAARMPALMGGARLLMALRRHEGCGVTTDAPRHAAMAHAAHNRAVSQFGLSREAAAIEQVYQDLWQDR